MERRRTLRFRTVLVVLVLAICHRRVAAQSSTGRFTGKVRDQTAASISEVELQAVEIDSGRSWVTTSDATGTFALSALPPGRYRIVARRAGFKTFTTDVIDLNINQTDRLDITMELGSVSDTIEVTGTIAPIQTDSTHRGLILSSRETVGLPGDGRNFISFILLVPGAVSPNLAPWTTGQRTASGGRPYLNGNRKEANNFQLDGVDANQTTDNLVAYQPSPDAIQEIQVITNTASADIGNYHGALINVALKSGTNQTHGSMFEFFRHDALNAAGWQSGFQPVDPLNPRRKPPLRHDVFGGTLGGALIKNRLFFFSDYQGTRRDQGRTTSFL